MEEASQCNFKKIPSLKGMVVSKSMVKLLAQRVSGFGG